MKLYLLLLSLLFLRLPTDMKAGIQKSSAITKISVTLFSGIIAFF